MKIKKNNRTPRTAPDETEKALFRIQFEVTPAQLETMERLIKMSPSSINSKRELFNAALSLYRWAVEQRLKGNIIGSRVPSEEHFYELFFPPIEEIKPIGQQPAATVV
jgi:hypothetical protein